MLASQPALQQLSKHAFVVAIPVALESLVGIVAPLGAEKRWELWVASLHLLTRREPMVSQVVAPTVADPRVDELPEFRGRALEPRRAVHDVQVEDHARVRLFGPGKKGLVVPLDRSEEHTSELQSHSDLVCRLLLEKKKQTDRFYSHQRATART